MAITTTTTIMAITTTMTITAITTSMTIMAIMASIVAGTIMATTIMVAIVVTTPSTTCSEVGRSTKFAACVSDTLAGAGQSGFQARITRWDRMPRADAIASVPENAGGKVLSLLVVGMKLV